MSHDGDGMNTHGTRLETLCWAEAESALKRSELVVIPVGAGTKEHGRHLPLNTDAVQAAYFLDRLLECRPVAALPTVPYGYYPAFVDYPGSVSLPLAVFRDTIVAIGRSIARHAELRFYVLNLGVSTNWALEPARLDLGREGIVLDYTDLTVAGRAASQALTQQPHGSHADEVETSRMLHIAPNAVHMDEARPELAGRDRSGPLTRHPGGEGIFSETGAWGDPTLASAEKGARLCELLLQAILADVDHLRAPDFQPAPARNQYL
jgi:creatinine amidohydrolase